MKPRKDIVFQQYPRTVENFSLDEILFIVELINQLYSVESIASLVQREPNQLIRCFFTSSHC